MFCPLYLPSTWVSPDWCPMTSSDWANGGWWFYGPFFGHAVVSGLWGGVGAIQGNGYGISVQNCVARFQGRVLWPWFCYNNLILDLWCFTWFVLETFKCPNGQQSTLPFQRNAIFSREEKIFSFNSVNPLSKSNWGRERRPNFVTRVVGSFFFVGGWVVMVWSKNSYLGPAEISPNVFLL